MAAPAHLLSLQLSQEQSMKAHHLPTSAGAAPQELTPVVVLRTPFLPQPTAFLKRHYRSCSTGAVHISSTSFSSTPNPHSTSGRDGASAKANSSWNGLFALTLGPNAGKGV